jgi:hypothetical protein
MKSGILALVLITTVVLAGTVFAQDPASDLPRFRILLVNGDRIEGKNGILTTSELVGVSNSGEQLRFARSDIRALDYSNGSGAARGAAIGAGMGLLMGLAVVLPAEASDNVVLRVNGGALTLGLTAGGALIGLAIGSAYPVWERVPMDVSLLADPAHKGGRCTIAISF